MYSHIFSLLSSAIPSKGTSRMLSLVFASIVSSGIVHAQQSAVNPPQSSPSAPASASVSNSTNNSVSNPASPSLISSGSNVRKPTTPVAVKSTTAADGGNSSPAPRKRATRSLSDRVGDTPVVPSTAVASSQAKSVPRSRSVPEGCEAISGDPWGDLCEIRKKAEVACGDLPSEATVIKRATNNTKAVKGSKAGESVAQPDIPLSPDSRERCINAYMNNI